MYDSIAYVCGIFDVDSTFYAHDNCNMYFVLCRRYCQSLSDQF